MKSQAVLFYDKMRTFSEEVRHVIILFSFLSNFLFLMMSVKHLKVFLFKNLKK